MTGLVMVSSDATKKAWHNLRWRCNNPSYPGWDRYGGRGITYDPLWKSYENFFSGMGRCPDGFFLDRIDNDLNYSKANCRWVPRLVSDRNKITTKLTIREVQLIKALLRARNPDIGHCSFCKRIAPLFNVTWWTIRDIWRGKSWPEIQPILPVTFERR